MMSMIVGRQLLVALAPMLAALSVGGTIGYPNILLQQLKTNDSTIELNLETSSWIGSIHGFASIPSILMPSVMQWQGRKLTFLLSCIFVTIGWILAYAAQSVTMILVSESFHGLGSQCVLTISYCSLSELIGPKFRSSSLTYYAVCQSIGIAATAIMGQYFHWKTLALIMITPIILGILTAWLIWPESPSWLALQGSYLKCKSNFKWLRGEGEDAKKELAELLHARQETKEKVSLFKGTVSRDFYVPATLMFLLLYGAYWSGLMVLIVYSPLIVKKMTNNQNVVPVSMIIINISLILGYLSCIVLMKRNIMNKTIISIGTVGVLLSSLICFIVTLLQSTGVLGESVIYVGILAFYIFIGFGFLMPSSFIISMELIAVKHRGFGGALYVVFSSLFHFSTLKLAPYMFEYINLSGSFLVYCINTALCGLLVWKFVPETKNRTLQELEDYFKHGMFIQRCTEDISTTPMITLAEADG